MATTSKNDILKYLKALLSENGSPQQQATDYFPYIIYVLDGAEKKITVVNHSRVTDYLGYSTEEITAWNNNYFQMIFKDDLEMVIAEVKKFALLDDDADHSYKCRLNHRKGDWRYFRTRGSVLNRNETGASVSWVFIAEDITETTKSQEEISSLKLLVDDTEELLSFGSWSWDLAIDQMYWTNGLYKLLGYEKEDVEPSISSDLYFSHVDPHDLGMLKRTIEDAVDNNSDFDITYNMITRTQEHKIVSSKGKTIRNANGLAGKVIGITRDITRQTRINRDLVLYKELIHEKEEFLDQGSWETSLADNVTTWSPGMFRLFGYNAGENPGTQHVSSSLYEAHMSEADAQRYLAEWKNILKEKDNFVIETTITDNNGRIKKLETYGKVIRETNLEPQKIFGTTRDVTRLREYERSLEEKIRELNHHNTELEDFAYVASHDLQEPLRKLTTFSERLRTKFSALLGGEGVLFLDRMVAATETMRLLIENLLEFSRTARSDKYFMQKDMAQLLDEVVAELEFRIDETGTGITSDPLPVMEVIPAQIKQLFDNLISNSIKFRKQDESCLITISCSSLSNAEKINYFLPEHKEYFKIELADNGIGFEKEYSERIFQIFQRLHGKSEYPGSGIGLAICKKIVENHNGLIFAKGNVGNGALFTIILPESQS